MTASSVPVPPEPSPPDAHPAARADLRDMAQRLADARRASLSATLLLELRRADNAAQFLENNHAAITAKAQAEKEVNSAEQSLRSFALAYYGMTQDKRPTPGVEIVIGVDYSIDEPAALAWAEKTGTALIPASVDMKAIKKIAKATPLPFATKIETPAVRVASDLDAALKESA